MKRNIIIIGMVVIVLLSGCSSVAELNSDETNTPEPTVISQDTVGETNLAETTQTELETTTKSQPNTTNLTQTQTVTETVTKTVTSTVTETATETSTSTQTPIPTDTETPTETDTETDTETPTDTPTPTPTDTETPTSTETATETETPTETVDYSFGKKITVKAVGSGESTYRMYFDSDVGTLPEADNASEATNPDTIGYSSEMDRDVVNGFVGDGGIDAYTTEGEYQGIENRGTVTLKVYIDGELVDTVGPKDSSIQFD